VIGRELSRALVREAHPQEPDLIVRGEALDEPSRSTLDVLGSRAQTVRIIEDQEDQPAPLVTGVGNHVPHVRRARRRHRQLDSCERDDLLGMAILEDLKVVPCQARDRQIRAVERDDVDLDEDDLGPEGWRLPSLLRGGDTLPPAARTRGDGCPSEDRNDDGRREATADHRGLLRLTLRLSCVEHPRRPGNAWTLHRSRTLLNTPELRVQVMPGARQRYDSALRTTCSVPCAPVTRPRTQSLVSGRREDVTGGAVTNLRNSRGERPRTWRNSWLNCVSCA
jgi:hypothetical protein